MEGDGSRGVRHGIRVGVGRAIDAHDALPIQGVKLPDEVLCHPVFPVNIGATLGKGFPLLDGLQGQAVVLRVRQAPLLQIVLVTGPGAVVLWPTSVPWNTVSGHCSLMVR